jgi:hypothetical protein
MSELTLLNADAFVVYDKHNVPFYWCQPDTKESAHIRINHVLFSLNTGYIVPEQVIQKNINVDYHDGPDFTHAPFSKVANRIEPFDLNERQVVSINNARLSIPGEEFDHIPMNKESDYADAISLLFSKTGLTDVAFPETIHLHEVKFSEYGISGIVSFTRLESFYEITKRLYLLPMQEEIFKRRAAINQELMNHSRS